jgi:hypothetical protein
MKPKIEESIVGGLLCLTQDARSRFIWVALPGAKSGFKSGVKSNVGRGGGALVENQEVKRRQQCKPPEGGSCSYPEQHPSL